MTFQLCQGILKKYHSFSSPGNPNVREASLCVSDAKYYSTNSGRICVMPIKRHAPIGVLCQYCIAFHKMRFTPTQKTEGGCCSHNPYSSEMDPYTYIILSQL